MTHKYKVSAIVSTYKSERFIRGCLEDLIEQTLYQQDQLEIIVIDSNSPENEVEIVKEFQAAYPHIIYQRTPERETLYAAWNRAIKLSSGEYITNANTDDRHWQGSFEILSNLLDRYKEVDLVYGDCYLSSHPNETFQNNSKERTYKYPTYFPPSALIHYQFGPQSLWRRSVHQKIGYFDPTLRAAGDFDFNIRFAIQGLKALHVSKYLGSFLVHDESISSQQDVMLYENSVLYSKYRTTENIQRLYEIAGVSINGEYDLAGIFIDFSNRFKEFYPPWAEGQAHQNLDATVLYLLLSLNAYPNLKAACILQDFIGIFQLSAKQILSYAQILNIRQDPIDWLKLYFEYSDKIETFFQARKHSTLSLPSQALLSNLQNSLCNIPFKNLNYIVFPSGDRNEFRELVDFIFTFFEFEHSLENTALIVALDNSSALTLENHLDRLLAFLEEISQSQDSTQIPEIIFLQNIEAQQWHELILLLDYRVRLVHENENLIDSTGCRYLPQKFKKDFE